VLPVVAALAMPVMTQAVPTSPAVTATALTW
jgi:hypothetical protein